MTFRRADVLPETFVCLILVVGDHNGIAALENIVAAIFAFVVIFMLTHNLFLLIGSIV